MNRRPSRRRNRRGAPPPARDASTAGTTAPAEPTRRPLPQQQSGFGRAALILALLLGTLAERAALSLPDDARAIFHFVVLLGIALLVARAYRGFVRRTIGRSRERRRNR